MSALLNRPWIFWFAVIVLLAIMGAVQVRSSRLECQTYDEAVHLAAGYSYLRTGDYRIGVDHTPLGKMMDAIPLLLWLKLRLPLADPSWVTADEWQFGKQFLYANSVSADTILAYARPVTIVLTLGLGLFLAGWTRRHFGADVALLAVFFFSLDPNVIAHGRYVTTDLIAAASIFVATMALARFIVSNCTWDGLLAGALLGLAIASKFSGLLLFPLYLVLYLIRWWQEGARRFGRALAHLALSLATLGIAAMAVIGAAYWSETLRMFRGTLAPLIEIATPSSPYGSLLHSAAALFHLPAHIFFLALLQFLDHNALGDPSYLLGKTFPTGVWYYFPVVFAVKTPAPILLSVFAMGCGVLVQIVRQTDTVLFERIRKARFEWIVLTVPVLLYFGMSLESKINLGVRHLLPIYPFLFILTAAALFRLRAGRFAALFPILLLTAVTVEAAESFHIYPHYLAFFNTLAGGPKAGPRYVVDSNIDWGQDLKKLKAYLDTLHNPPVCMAYFGSAIPEYYGISRTRLPATEDIAGRRDVDCLAAVSVTFLHDLYLRPGTFRWLREKEPIERIGYSIYIYDLRKPRP